MYKHSHSMWFVNVLMYIESASYGKHLDHV